MKYSNRYVELVSPVFTVGVYENGMVN